MFFSLYCWKKYKSRDGKTSSVSNLILNENEKVAHDLVFHFLCCSLKDFSLLLSANRSRAEDGNNYIYSPLYNLLS